MTPNVSIKELRDKRAGKLADMQVIALKETDEAPLGDDDVASFNALKEECDRLEARIARLTASIDPDADDADEVADDAAEKAWGGEPIVKRFNINTSDEIRVPRQKGEAAGRYLIGMYWAKQFGLQAAKDMVDREMGDAPVRKSLVTTAEPIIPQQFVTDWIQLLQEKSVVRPLATVYPMPVGNITIPRQRLGSTGSFFSEGQQITVSQLAFDAIQLTWHKYGAMTYTSRELLEFSPLNAAGIVANDLTDRLALLEDRSALNSTGSGGVPVGIIASVAASNQLTNTVNGSSAVDFQTVSADLQAMELALTGHLVRGNFTWIMHPGVVGFLKQLSSTMGVFPFRQELSGPNPTLNGFPVRTTVQLPSNLGVSGANKTNIVLLNGSDFIIGDAYKFAVSMTTEGSFLDGSTQVNAFGQDIVAWKATNAVDWHLRHDVSAAVLAASDWSLSTVGGIDSYTGQAADVTNSSASSATRS